VKNDTTSTNVLPASSVDLLAGSPKDVLTEILRHGACELLATAVEAEVAGYIEEHAGHVDEQGHRLVVRNGHHRERMIQTGLGPVAVKAPRVDDRRVIGMYHQLVESNQVCTIPRAVAPIHAHRNREFLGKSRENNSEMARPHNEKFPFKPICKFRFTPPIPPRLFSRPSARSHSRTRSAAERPGKS